MPDGSAPECVAAEVAALLLENGQTTEGIHLALHRLGPADLELGVRWGELVVSSPRQPGGIRRLATPLAVDIGRVGVIERAVDRIRTASGTQAQACLRQLAERPPVSLARFAIMAGLGAAGLGVIFGVDDWQNSVAIAASAGAGACLRRFLARWSANPFLQPFAASVLAGAFAGCCVVVGAPISERLLAVCPCMVLVPGPHLLNGSIDLVRARIPRGAARLAYASLILLGICAGLLLGLSLTGASLGAPGPSPAVPLALDVSAAGVAVAAYGSFFNMPWRTLPVPIVIGMLGHALRWALLAAGFSVQAGALGACLFVGAVVSPLSHWMRLPFGALAFASVVSFMPGVFLFQAAAEATALIGSRAGEATAHLLALSDNGITAFLVAAAITTGLIVPKLCLDAWLAARVDDRPDQT